MMKRTIIVSAAFAATLATLAGCNTGGGSYEQTFSCPYEITEKGPDGTYVTKITYKLNSINTDKEVKTLDDVLFSESTNFTAVGSNPASYTQTTYEGGATTRKKMVTTYGLYYNGFYYETKNEAFLLASESDTKGNLVESVETKYAENSTKPNELIHMKDGVVVLRNYDYDYTNASLSSNPYYTYKQSVNGGEPTNMCFYIIKLSYDRYGNVTGYSEYEIYKGWVDTANRGTLVESRSEYSFPDMTEKYTMKYLNEETGVLETTNVTREYVDITVRNE